MRPPALALPAPQIQFRQQGRELQLTYAPLPQPGAYRLDVNAALVTDRAGSSELLIRTPLRELLPRLDANRFWQVHRSAVVNVTAIDRVIREGGKLRIHIRGRPETLEVSRMYAHRFKAM